MDALLGDCAATDASTAMSTISTFGTRTLSTFSTFFGSNDVVLEVTGAVGLGPQTDATLDRRTQDRVVLGEQIRIRRSAVAARARRAAERVCERELAVEPRLEVGAVHRHLQL